jgi:phosphoribosyl 1,2-cyclic phosphodiesterase
MRELALAGEGGWGTAIGYVLDLTRMSLELCILASGSSGNATVLRCPAGVMLIDLGIGPRTTAKRLLGTGVGVGDIAAVCLTHLDGDHFNFSWVPTLIRRKIRLFCHIEKGREILRTVAREFAGQLGRLVHAFEDGAFWPLEGVRFHPFPLAHDRSGSHGFVIDGFDYRIGFATDLGHVPAHLHEHFRDLNLIALESNYDPMMQEQSARPMFLKRRIMGGKGHLSNRQALAAVQRILDRGHRLPDHIVLLHRSRQCNCPDLVRALFSKDRRIGPRLTLAEQYERTPWLRRKELQPGTGEQLMLAF